ncbi:MAG: mannonate dehydratase [Bacteroidia bacterium]
MQLIKTLRWFGDKDPVSLSDIRQAGATGVVTALHHIPNGNVWSVEEIQKVKSRIEAAGLTWEVVESLPVHEAIKQATSDRDEIIENYKISLKNLGKCGVKTVCYNFMPVIDWVRTDLHYQLPNGAEAMYFQLSMFIAFDIFILKRPHAESDYTPEQVAQAKSLYEQMSPEEAEKLAYNIIIVTQAFIDGSVDPNEADPKKIFLQLLKKYDHIDKHQLRENFAYFLNEVIPVAEESGVNLAVHPDDPPFPLLGLPRIVSSEEDFEWLIQAVPSLHNGITFCSGSLGARPDNHLPSLFRKFGNRVHFLHLRITKLLENGDFFEAEHLSPNNGVIELMEAIIEEQNSRQHTGRADLNIPMRPDHGHKILDDFKRKANPGYPLIGRLKGLAELYGLEQGLRYKMKYENI